MAVWKPAVARVKEEVADMQALADKEGAKIKIEPWDYRYYMEKVRKAKYDLDQNEVKPYLQLDKLREANVLGRGRAIQFQVHSRGQCSGRSSGRHAFGKSPTKLPASTSVFGISILMPAQGKRSGAWMNAYRSQERVNGEDHNDRFEQLELRQRQARRAGADLVG